MESSLFLFCMLIFLSGVAVSSAQNQCQTPSGEKGSCIPLRECTPMYSILTTAKSKGSEVSESDKSYLRQIHCGFNGNHPLVCCANSKRFSDVGLPTPGMKCGIHIQDRILGGERASIGEYPWVALLEYSRPNATNVFLCGGVLINEHYILTAAHCINGSKNQYRLVSVRLGEHDLTTNPDCDYDFDYCADPVVDVPVAETIVHEDYEANSTAQHNDIALIRLSRPVTFNDFINPICLPVPQNLKDAVPQYVGSSTALMLAGFGRTENGAGSNVKLRTSVDNVNITECNKIYDSLNISLTSKQLCAGGQQRNDFCKGDSGGAITKIGKGSSYIPYSFVSGIETTNCGGEGKPAIYTNVAEYVDWIINHMRH